MLPVIGSSRDYRRTTLALRRVTQYHLRISVIGTRRTFRCPRLRCDQPVQEYGLDGCQGVTNWM